MVATMAENNGGGFIKFLLLSLLICGTGLLLLSYEKSHAVAKHGLDAELARECMNKNGPSKTFYKVNFMTGNIRKGHICFDPVDEEFFVQIIEGDDEVTAFARRRADGLKVSWDEITHYMRSKFWVTKEEFLLENPEIVIQ